MKAHPYIILLVAGLLLFGFADPHHIISVRLDQYLHFLSVEYWIPEALMIAKPGSNLRCYLAFVPASLFLAIILCNIMFFLLPKKKNLSLLVDNEFDIRHGPMATPTIDHLTPFFSTLPEPVRAAYRFQIVCGLLDSSLTLPPPSDVIDDDPSAVIKN